LDEQAKETARNAFKQDRDTKTNAFLEILSRLDKHKSELTEENGWSEAWNSHLESQGGKLG